MLLGFWVATATFVTRRPPELPQPTRAASNPTPKPNPNPRRAPTFFGGTAGAYTVGRAGREPPFAKSAGSKMAQARAYCRPASLPDFSMASARREHVFGDLVIRLAGRQAGRRVVWSMRRIRRVLRLQAEPGARLVSCAALSGDAAQLRADVSLHAGPGGAQQHPEPRHRLDDLGDGAQGAVPAVDGEAVIVADPVAQLRVVGADARAERRA